MSDQSVVWDGKDMAAVQMLLHDLRENGEPAARWSTGWNGKPVLHLRMFPGDVMLHLAEAGTKIIRFHGGDHLGTVFEKFPTVT